EIANLFVSALERINPDIITFSEASLTPILNVIIDELGMRYAVFPSYGCWHGVVLTKYRIKRSIARSLSRRYWSRMLFSRHWGTVLLDTDLGQIVIHSLHLYPDPKGSIINREVREVARVVRREILMGKSVIVQGDLNHEPTDPVYKVWSKTGLIDAFEAVGFGSGETFKSDAPSRRIDYILVGGPLRERLKECRTVREKPFMKLRKGDLTYSLSDHLPVTAMFT
ncbi:hypothetical protein CW702_01285, partial [Candidatus Bathyarchaeota archaeon]